MHGPSMAEKDPDLVQPEAQIFLLGAPRAEWHASPLAIPRRQARALLYRLAVAAEAVPRENLCFLLWPDLDEATARQNLSRVLTILHAALPDAGLLIARNDAVELHPQQVWSDTRAFDQLWADWKKHGDPINLRQAADLHRGPFLAGFSLAGGSEFDTWASQERERWTQRSLQALAVLSEVLSIDKDYNSAIECVRRYLAIDELAEDMHRRLMALYGVTGNRSAASQHYERCVATLERELGVDPTPETQAVYRAILQGNLVDAVAASEPQGTAGARLSHTAPLIGRTAELRTLDEAYRQARAGHGSAILIAGEPGVGKSRLMQEFASQLRSQALVLSGCCYYETRASPYQPLVDALRPHLAIRRFEFVAHEEQPWLAELAPLFGELRPLRPELPHPPVTEPGWARTRLFEALETLLLRLAHSASITLLCLDDLHWSDTATLDWVAYLSRHLDSRPLLIVATYRSEDAGHCAALHSSLARHCVPHELTLEGLDEAGVHELMRCMASAVPSDPTLAGRIHRATGGNPFFLLETLAVLKEAGERLEQLPWLEALPIPDSVRQAVQLRVERLSQTARQVLEAASVAGQAFSYEALQLTAGRTEMETADAVDELLAQQLLVEESGQVRFRHEIVREAIGRELRTYRRQLLHRRAAEALLRLRPEDAGALAHHFAEAGLPGPAARYALQAGLAAKRVFAHVEARSHFDRALALLEQEAAGLRDAEALAANRRLRIQALSERGWALRLLGDMDAYARDLDEEAQMAELLGDIDTRAHLRWRQASAHLWFCRYERALAVAEDGLRLSREAGDRLLEAGCLRATGLAARAVGDYSLARQALQEALQLFADLDQPSLQVHTLGNLSTLACYQDAPAQALDLARLALALCETARLQPDRRLPLGDIGAAALALGDVCTAREALVESLAIARQVCDRTQEILCLGYLGWLDVQKQHATQALEHLRAALALAEEVSSCAEQSWLHAGLAEALRLDGDRDAAATHARQAVALAGATGRVHDQRLARQVLDLLTAH